MRMYIQEMGRTLALPQGAEETAPMGDGGWEMPDAGCWMPDAGLTRQWPGRKGGEGRSHADGAHAGATAAVRDGEGLVQVQVAHVGADVAGAAEADLGVHVGAVHINQPAVLVDDAADVLDGFLEDAVGGGVSHHERGEFGAVLLSLGPEVGEADVAVVVAGHGHDAQAGHDGAGGVGAVGGGRDQTDAPMIIAARIEVSADDEQAGVFALGAGVGLEGDGGKAGDFGEPGFKLAEERGVAGGLFAGREGVQAPELGPGHGEHFRGGVELHGAGAQRDHGAGEREVARLQLADVAEHLGLGMVAVEDGMSEEE